jgi:hypothetical protein
MESEASLALGFDGAFGDASDADAELAAGCAVCAHPVGSRADPEMKTKVEMMAVRIFIRSPSGQPAHNYFAPHRLDRQLR